MIIPGVNDVNFDNIKTDLIKLNEITPLMHVDVSDNTFIDHLTFTDLQKLDELLLNCKLELHLMVDDPAKYIQKRLSTVFRVIAHIEIDEKKLEDFIETANKNHYEIGIAVNPRTPSYLVAKYLDRVSFIQFMGYNPGKKGQDFQYEALDKIRFFRHKYKNSKIQVDGGVNDDTLGRLIDSGIDSAVVVSAIFNSKDPLKKYIKYREFLEDSIMSLRYKKKQIKAIGFLGGAQWNKEDKAYVDAFETAKLLAENGYGIVNGGGPGVMRASTKGAHAGGGKALAITYYPNKPKMHYEGVDLENDFDEEVKTLDYFDRTKVMLQTTDMHIVFNGSIGTLSELGMTWIRSWIHEPVDKPIVLFGSFWQEYINYVKEHMLLKHQEEHLLHICNTPQEVLEYIKYLSE